MALVVSTPALIQAVDQRNDVTFLRGPHNQDFYRRHHASFRTGSAIHLAHGEAHDEVELTPLEDHDRVDAYFSKRWKDAALHHPPFTEPTMDLYGPYTARVCWNLYRAIDWTHMHHEQTYDILSSRQIAWNKKKEWTDKAVRYYLKHFNIPRSPAPLDVTMRRAGTMMKPYFSLFRNYYPQSNDFFYAAHWWHPAVYEAQMIGGQGSGQDEAVSTVESLFQKEVIQHPPKRMLLSREMMPRYSRMSPESANIFDNLHMLHGIAYDILSYDKWTPNQKRAELERVIKAMSYQPGDEKLARKFKASTDFDPRQYSESVQSFEGDMNRIMLEMMDEMMPMMMPNATPEMKQKVQEQVRMKLTSGMQEGELPGSLHDALMKLMPDMKMMPGAMEPGESSPMMLEAMMRGWQEKYGNLPDVEPWPMDAQTAEARP